MFAIDDAKAPPPTPEKPAAMITWRYEGPPSESASAIQMHGIARRTDVKKTTLRPPTMGVTNEFGRRKMPPESPADAGRRYMSCL